MVKVSDYGDSSIVSARYADECHDSIVVEFGNGDSVFIPVDNSNRDYINLLESAIDIQDYRPSVESYIEKRLAEYPPIGDQLDALWKGGAEAEEMKKLIMAVKLRYPKVSKNTLE